MLIGGTSFLIKNPLSEPQVRQSEIRRISPIRNLKGDTDQERSDANPGKPYIFMGEWNTENGSKRYFSFLRFPFSKFMVQYMIYLETERLVLRDWREEDLVVFSQMNRDPRVMEYFLKPLTETESRDFYERIRREIDTFGWGLFAVEVKISGKFIGYIGLHHTNFETDFCPCIEIGWRLCGNSWGQGYATEGARACLDFAFKQLQLPEIYSFTSLPNRRSERVMQKIGLQKIGEFDHPLVPAGHPLLRHVLYRAEKG